MKVIKVINNNNLCVLDENGREQIVSGKGIGFGKKYEDKVTENQIQKTYLTRREQEIPHFYKWWDELR